MTEPTPNATFSLGVGLTNACNLACAHCYRSTGTDELSIAELLASVDALPTRAVNFGTGENGLHADFGRAVRELTDRGIAVTMTTNGFSAEALPDDLLSRFRDVEFSIDYPTREAHDEARSAGNWDLIEAQMARCAELGVATTIACVLMSTNYKALPDLVHLAGERGALLRVNVYQAVHRDTFSLTYDQFWDAWKHAFEVADLITCGEPILRAVLALPRPAGAGCGVSTVRVTPRGAVVPCVYGADAALTIADLVRLGPGIVEEEPFKRLALVPESCKACPHVATCGGGCPSRRSLRGNVDQPDEFCPYASKRPVSLTATLGKVGRELPKAASACTTILLPREAPRSRRHL